MDLNGQAFGFLRLCRARLKEISFKVEEAALANMKERQVFGGLQNVGDV